MRYAGLFTAMAILAAPVSAQAERLVTVDFSEAHMTVTDERGAIVYSTHVVLPRSNWYQLPATGTVTKAEMGPTWVPTPRMIRSGKYRSYYGPYAPGNAMGDCKISINFGRKSMRYVRIHGNAENHQLGQRLSSGCIRTPDALCTQLVRAVNESPGPVRVVFKP